VPDLQLGGCGFEYQPGLLRTKVYSAFHPSRVGKWVPDAAGKAKAGMAHSDCGWSCGCAGKTVKSLENTCHTWALLWWWFSTKRLWGALYQVYAPLPLPLCTVRETCLGFYTERRRGRKSRASQRGRNSRHAAATTNVILITNLLRYGSWGFLPGWRWRPHAATYVEDVAKQVLQPMKDSWRSSVNYNIPVPIITFCVLWYIYQW